MSPRSLAIEDRPVAWAAPDRPPAAPPAPRRSLAGLVLPAAVLLLWEVATRFAWVKPIFVPAPRATLEAFFEMLLDGRLLADFAASLKVVAGGFAAGAGSGLLVGACCGGSRLVSRVLGPSLDAFRQIPPLAWLPLVILWVGVGDTAKIVVIAKVVFFPVFLNTVQGIRGIAREYIEVGRVLCLTPLQLARRIVLPGALPSILVGLRYGAGLSWAYVVAAEMLSGLQGLGFLVWRAQELLLTDQLFVSIGIIGLFGFLLDRALLRLERRLLRWRPAPAA